MLAVDFYFISMLQVRQVNESTVLQQKAYMLFYVRSRNSAPRKLVETSQEENLRAINCSWDRASSFAFSKSISSAVQVSQLTDKCSATLSSSSSVITEEATSVCSLKKLDVSEYVPKDLGKLGAAVNANLENKMVKNDANGDSIKKFNILNGPGETFAEPVFGHETAGKVT